MEIGFHCDANVDGNKHQKLHFPLVALSLVELECMSQI